MTLTQIVRQEFQTYCQTNNHNRIVIDIFWHSFVKNKQENFLKKYFTLKLQLKDFLTQLNILIF